MYGQRESCFEKTKPEQESENYSVIEVKNKDELNILKEQQASYGRLKFAYSDQHIEDFKKRLDAKNALQLMVKDGNKFCGYLAAYEEDSWGELFKNFYLLHDLFVSPEYQKSGIGSGLINRCLEKAQELKLKGVMTETEFENLPAQKTYEKLGFVKVENKNWEDGITYRLTFDDKK